jgi:hypothetical protein
MIYLLGIAIYMEVVNFTFKTNFDILYIPLVRNTEQQFKKGIKYGIFLLILFIAPLIAIKYFFEIEFFKE